MQVRLELATIQMPTRPLNGVIGTAAVSRCFVSSLFATKE